MHYIMSLKLISIVLLSSAVAYGNTLLSETKRCALLYKEKYSESEGGQSIFREETHVPNLYEEHILSDDKWNGAFLSFRVETGCQLIVCNQAYFSRRCETFYERHAVQRWTENIRSFKCFCTADSADPTSSTPSTFEHGVDENSEELEGDSEQHTIGHGVISLIIIGIIIALAVFTFGFFYYYDCYFYHYAKKSPLIV